jgi:CRISPR-associated protein Csb2
MIAIRLHFDWGRYYAHPWGLNPARLREAEWPPSPWRMLRSLAAAWFQANRGQPAPTELHALLEALGAGLPEICIGPVTFGQTVHWQPNFENAKKDAASFSAAQYGAKGKHRHENHFAATESPVLFCWRSFDPTPPQRALLAGILPHVNYFGRSESICTVDLLPQEAELPKNGWCRPCVDPSTGAPIRRIAENCRDVFCPDTRDFQAADLWSRRADRDALNPNHAPPHLVEDLLSHQPLPDGARWVSYQMPEGWPGRWIVRVPKSLHPKTMSASPTPRVAHYLHFSLQCRIPIPLRFTVPLAEQFRSRALHYFGKATDVGQSFALSGHDKPADVQGDHQHAFYLPLGANPHHPEHITEIHVWCAYGFTQVEVEAMMRVQRLDWGGGKDHPIRPILLELGKSVPSTVPIATGQHASRVWQSRTPFVPPRYFYRGNLHGGKLKEKDAPERQLAQCLHQAGITVSGEIRRLTLNGDAQETLPPLAAWDIVRTPEGETDSLVSAVTHTTAAHAPRSAKERRVGIFLRITFVDPVALPFPSLGHSSHFGLGLFVPR